MKFISKSEWFEFPSPIGEPEIDWNKLCPYSIERIVKSNGEIIWFGLGTNWVKGKEGWTVLTTDETVKPLEENGCVYPENRNYFKPCEMPIYEKLYLETRP